MRAALLTLLLLAAQPLAAWPTLHAVTGVAQGDSLNIRAVPSATAPIIGALAAEAQGVEITATEGNWGRVNTTESAGWVALRYLTPANADDRPPDAPLSCYGTEPFWSLDVTADLLITFSDAEGNQRSTKSGPPMTAEGRIGMAAFLAPEVALILDAQTCSDGMSDRLYGIAARLLLTSNTPRLLSGCCSIGAR